MVCLGVLACNQIVGVEDVRLRGTGARPTTTDTNDAGDTTKPDPVTPTVDASTDAGGSGCNGALTCERSVFLTSQTFTGKLGGLAGADAICFNAAKNGTTARLKGRLFRAWLGDATKNADDRIPHGTQAFLRGDGATFVTSYRTMTTSGSVGNTLNVDEQGNQLTGAALDLGAWTGTNTAGLSTANNCNNWTSEATGDNGSVGDSQATDSTWTQFSTATSCNAKRRLYCIEY